MGCGWAFSALALAGCAGPYGIVEGSIGDEPFIVETVYHGGPYILLFDREIDCIDTAWVEAAYGDGEAVSEKDFVALQLSTEGEAFEPGTFSIEGDANASAVGLVNVEGTLDTERGREGTLTISEVASNGEWLEGSFEVEFASSGVSGEFRTKSCRNMQP